MEYSTPTLNTSKERAVHRHALSSDALRIGYFYCSGFGKKNTEQTSKFSPNPFQSPMGTAEHSGWQLAEQTLSDLLLPRRDKVSSLPHNLPLTCHGSHPSLVGHRRKWFSHFKPLWAQQLSILTHFKFRMFFKKLGCFGSFIPTLPSAISGWQLGCCQEQLLERTKSTGWRRPPASSPAFLHLKVH